MIKKRNLLWLLVPAMAIASVGCKQEPAAGDVNAPSGKIKLAATFENVQDEGSTKVDISTSGAFTWTEGDKIAVHTSTSNWQRATLESGAGSASGVFTAQMNDTDRDGYAIYPASVASGSADAPTITLPSSYRIDGSMGRTFSPLPMIAVNEPGTALAFKHVGGIFRITLNKVPQYTRSIVVTMDKQITGTFTVDVSDASKPTITTTGAASNNTVTFNFSTAFAAETDNVVLNVPVPVGLYTSFRVETYSGRDSSASFMAGTSNDAVRNILRSYGSKVALDIYPDWAVSGGEFSVSASQKVYFAKGNLIARLGTSEIGQDPSRFYLAANPWDYVYNKTTGGYNSGNTSLASGRDYDLFCWSGDGASSYKWGIATGSVSASNFAGSFRDWGNNIICADATSTTGYSGSWRTLTREEWTYLFNTRTTTNNYRYVRAIVHSINGVIVFPDNYDTSIKTFSNVNVRDTAWDSVPSVSDSEWTAMEEAGCVFLPCAGNRHYSGTLDGEGFVGYYWSSDALNGNNAYDLCIVSTNIYPDTNDYRSQGYSVRLVLNK